MMNEKYSSFNHSAVRSVDRFLMSHAAAVPGMEWYVVQTKPRQESRALDQLRREGYACFVPALDVEQNMGNALQVAREPRFPRYLLVQLDDAERQRARLLRTPAVTGVLCIGGRPAPVPQAVVAALLKEAEHDAWHHAPGQLGEPARRDDDGVTRALAFIELLIRPKSAEPARMRRAA